MSGDHERGATAGEFCTCPNESLCKDCGGHGIKKNYRAICEPDWSDHTFERRVKKKGHKATAFKKEYEAHHILCVAPVTEQLLGEPKLVPLVKKSKWCINNELNMTAMPLWGHTVKWYCSLEDEDDDDYGELEEGVGAPPFKNIPQHDFDHNTKMGYTFEVAEAMAGIANQLEEAKDVHKLPAGSLVEELNDHSKHFASELKDRGKRKGGTHKAWGLALKGDAKWCLPFSMATEAEVTRVGFPAKDFKGKLDKWIKRIAEAIKVG